MMAPKIVALMPMYGAASYTTSALETFFETTPHGCAFVIDDKSPTNSEDPYTEGWAQQELSKYGERIVIMRTVINAQLTPVLNLGFQHIFKRWPTCDYIASVNNDILFTHNWYKPMVRAIGAGFHLVGPMSNAPGITAHGAQEINNYLDDYKLTDDWQTINDQAEQLRCFYEGQRIVTKVNGFFLFSSREHWDTGRWDAEKVFQCPIPRMPSGRRNPTPLMTAQEDELQHRWGTKLQRKFCACLDSFIFHYRSVSRGKRFRIGLWARKQKTKA